MQSPTPHSSTPHSHPPHSKWRRRIRHARRLLGYGALVLLILAAAMVGVANQLLPWVERNPDKIAAWLSDRVGQPLHFRAAYAEWTRRGPRFILSDLRVGATGEALEVGSAELLVAVYSGLLPGTPLTELKVRELSLELVQGDDRRWRLLGLPASKRPKADPLAVLEGFGELQIERASLRISAPKLGIDTAIPRVDMRLRVGSDRIRGGLRAWSRDNGKPLEATVDLARGRWSGRMWAGGDALELADWAELLRGTGIDPRGHGDVDVWAKIEAQQVDGVQAELDLAELALEARVPWLQADAVSVPGTSAAAGTVPDKTAPASPVTRFARLRLSAAWQATGDGWQLRVPQLRIRESEDHESNYDGLWMAGGDTFALRAPQLALAPVRALLPLSERLPDGLRQWLYRAAPQGELRDVEVVANRDGVVRGQLRLHDLAWSPSGNRPGASGLAGSVVFDERGGVIRLREQSPVVFDWPVGFGEPLDINLRGSLAWWREGPRWAFGSSGLRVVGVDFAASLRTELRQGEPGHKPRLDVAAEVDPTRVAAAKHFWVRHKMPPASVKWLDTALVDGVIQHGRASLGGDLEHWPFANGLGRFDARAEVRQARLKFHADWPEAYPLDVDVAFDGPGMSLQGSGRLLDSPVETFSGGIVSFKQPWLVLDIASKGEGAALRELLRASPLHKTHGEHIDAVSIEGAADVAVHLRLPLKQDLGERTITGALQLDGATVHDSRWDIGFTDVRGLTRFSHAGFATEALQVKLEGEPGTFDLNVGADTGDAGLAALAKLSGEFSSDTLLKQHPPLAWLQPWLLGRSHWQLAVRVPKAEVGRSAPPAQLSVSSGLVGTQIRLPAPLAKPAGDALALQLDTALPLSRGELRLRLGEIFRLRGRQSEHDTALNGAIDLGDAAEAPIPVQGLVVHGRVARLDAAGWIAFAAQGCASVASAGCAGATASGGGEGASNLRLIDVRAENFDLAGSLFNEVRMQLTKTSAGSNLTLEGATLAGQIDVPSEIARGVRGRLARMFWPATPPSDEGPAPLPDAKDEPDPSKWPPLDFVVDDLRLGEARYGRAEMATQPQPEGLRVSRFQTRSPQFALDAEGRWQRGENGRLSQSDFQIDFSAKSLGELLGNFGLKGVVQGGPTQGKLAGSWPGSPGAFQLARFTGRLGVKVGEGQLLDVEPGGSGRLLGLLSLAEIPRRLTLDFSDFFEKGFGFNTVSGDFQFTDGRARTDNLKIDGPAAEIRIQGLTDMRAQTYAQRIEVLPRTGGVLPALGALAGGPAGAALGAVAQAVLNKPLKQATRTVYRVEGPWKEPQVEVIERGPPKPGTAPTKESR